MKKKIIHIFQNRFTIYDLKNREYIDLEKRFKIKFIIHDLAEIYFPKFKFYAKSFKGSKKFKSLNVWKKKISQYSKKKNVVVINELGFNSFKSFLINLFLQKTNLPIIFDCNIGVVDRSDFDRSFDLKKTKLRILNILKNPFRLLIFIQSYFVKFLNYYVKFNKVIVLSAGKHVSIPFRYEYKKALKVHSRDYSNYLNLRKKIKFKKKKPIVFFDAPYPYFPGDYNLLYGTKHKINLEKWYNDHDKFFQKLEDNFSTKVIIVPHPKAKGLKVPFYKKRIIDQKIDASAKLTPNALFVISGVFVSTAISFAVASSKPILFIFSDQDKLFHKREVIFQKESSKLLGSATIDINKFERKIISKNLKIDKIKYNNYKYRYLTSKNLPAKPNHFILKQILEKL